MELQRSSSARPVGSLYPQRRLAYAALLARTSGERALFDATLVNALAHHGLEVDPDEAAGADVGAWNLFISGRASPRCREPKRSAPVNESDFNGFASSVLSVAAGQTMIMKLFACYHAQKPSRPQKPS